MDDAQLIRYRIVAIEKWFGRNPGVYNVVKRDELRTMYGILGNERKVLEQSNIILAHQFNDSKTLLLLSESKLEAKNDTTKTINKLLNLALRYPKFEYVGAAARLRAGDLLATQGKNKAALATYQSVFNGPGKYAQLAKEKYRKMKKI